MSYLIILVLGIGIGMVGFALIARNNAKKAQAALEGFKKKD